MKQLLFLLTIAALFIGCGNSSTEDANSTKISLSACSSYTDLQAGDTIVSESSDTNVSIIHDGSGNKSACVSSGSAYIQR